MGESNFYFKLRIKFYPILFDERRITSRYGLHTIMYAVCMTDRQTFTGEKRHLMKTYIFKENKKSQGVTLFLVNS